MSYTSVVLTASTENLNYLTVQIFKNGFVERTLEIHFWKLNKYYKDNFKIDLNDRKDHDSLFDVKMLFNIFNMQKVYIIATGYILNSFPQL